MLLWWMHPSSHCKVRWWHSFAIQALIPHTVVLAVPLNCIISTNCTHEDTAHFISFTFHINIWMWKRLQQGWILHAKHTALEQYNLNMYFYEYPSFLHLWFIFYLLEIKYRTFVSVLELICLYSFASALFHSESTVWASTKDINQKTSAEICQPVIWDWHGYYHYNTHVTWLHFSLYPLSVCGWKSRLLFTHTPKDWDSHNRRIWYDPVH